MISNNEIKRIRSLERKKVRDGLGLFVVEGEKMVSEAVSSGFGIEAVYRRDDIGEEMMSRISLLSSPSPVLAVVRKPEGTEAPDPGKVIEKLRRNGRSGGLFLALDTIRDPGNLGTILRVADWFGIDGVFASHDTVDVFNPKVVQATMGAIFRVDFHYTDIREACRAILACGGKVYGTFLDGEDMYSSDIATGDDFPVMMITGNEAEGISPEVGELCSGRLFIPPYPAGRHGSESLNAAVATAIALAEFRRRKFSV